MTNLVGRGYNDRMDALHEEPPRPPSGPLDNEEAGCVSGAVLLVAIAVTGIMLFLWLLRRFW